MSGSEGGGSHHIEDLGLAPQGFIGDEYVVELDLAPRHLNIGGIVHGGVLCSLLDTAMARSFFMAETGDKLSAATLEMKINFLGSAKSGKLTARGRVAHRTQRTAFVEGWIEDEEGRPLARATATIMVFATGGVR
ncbi:PaaI family thioesterase [bacterium]|nr:PaaI family thioesterase [bacterium]